MASRRHARRSLQRLGGRACPPLGPVSISQYPTSTANLRPAHLVLRFSTSQRKYFAPHFMSRDRGRFIQQPCKRATSSSPSINGISGESMNKTRRNFLQSAALLSAGALATTNVTEAAPPSTTEKQQASKRNAS